MLSHEEFMSLFSSTIDENGQGKFFFNGDLIGSIQDAEPEDFDSEEQMDLVIAQIMITMLMNYSG